MAADLLEVHVCLRADTPVVVDEAGFVAAQPCINVGDVNVAVLRVEFKQVIDLPMARYNKIIRVRADGAHACILQQISPGADVLGGKDATPDFLVD